ncbi:DUF2213 domain-containing protein [Helicobacter ganmani]|uniref:DUF2213 domain-containing protein n=1 Tax=Helicobacter ganmani TaxID=60246 RepID=UPI003A83C44A
MLTIKLTDSTHREKDPNGFLIIRNNPIAKAGVFDYLLCEIIPDCRESERNKVVKVYRDFEMLKSVKDTFANKPIKDEHYWVGEETNTADGAIGSEVSVDNEKLYLIADLFIYNPLLIAKIEKGEAVELSPAYTSEIIAEKGVFDGVTYEYKQNIHCFNHLAVVENGRSGKDLKIQDKGLRMGFKEKIVSAISKVFDELPENEKTQDNDEVDCNDGDKREIIREIMAIAAKPDSEFHGGENEKVETIAALVEKAAYNQDAETEAETETKDNEEAAEATTETGKTASVNVSELKQEILNEVAEAVQEAVVKAQDSMITIQKIKESAYQKVQDSIKAPFDYSKMSVTDIYKVGYEALTGSKMDSRLDAQTAFTLASQSSASSTKTQDSSVSTLNLSKFK